MLGKIGINGDLSCLTEEKLPRRIASVVIRAKKRWTMLSQELPVGVK